MCVCVRERERECVCVRERERESMLLRKLTAARNETFAPGPSTALSTTVKKLFSTSAVQHMKVVGRQGLFEIIKERVCCLLVLNLVSLLIS